jgi:hypothetical protein
MTKKQKINRLSTYFYRRGYMQPITLGSVLNELKKKFKLKELGMRELYVVGGWRYNKDDLRCQPKYCVDLVYYLIFIPLPRPKKSKCDECKDLPEGEVVKGHDHR